MIKLIDIGYQNTFAFWEYYFYNKPNIWGPHPEVSCKKVELKDRGHVKFSELVQYPNDPAIVIFMTPVKHIKWRVGNDEYRMRCYTTVQFDHPRTVSLEVLEDMPEYFFVLQGNLDKVKYVEPNRTPYKKFVTEQQVQKQFSMPVPDYITAHDGNWSVIDQGSETTVISHTDAGWWFDYESFRGWYSPYQLTWRKLGVNSISWRTPGEKQFHFGFEHDPITVAKFQAELVKKYLPKTKKIIYFGQCLGTSFALQTAYMAEQCDGVYLTTPTFDISKHKASNLMELMQNTASLTQMDCIEYLHSRDPSALPGKFVFKKHDLEEQRQLEQWNLRVNSKYQQHTTTHNVDFLDVFAPVFSNKEYGILDMLESQLYTNHKNHDDSNVDANTVDVNDDEVYKHR